MLGVQIFWIRIKLLVYPMYVEQIARRFYGGPSGRTPAYFQIDGILNFAILNFHGFGIQPMQPWDRRFRGDDVLDERVLFTFLMNSKKEVSLGNTRISAVPPEEISGCR
jgi:hypothetical protein